jgi:hypothetical protein
MATLHDPVFADNDFVRLSWAPAKHKIKEQGCSVTFQADMEVDKH